MLFRSQLDTLQIARNICALQAALYQTPEILHPVSVDFTAHVFNGVVYHSVLELVQTFIRIEGIG